MERNHDNSSDPLHGVVPFRMYSRSKASTRNVVGPNNIHYISGICPYNHKSACFHSVRDRLLLFTGVSLAIDSGGLYVENIPSILRQMVGRDKLHDTEAYCDD